MHNVRYSCHKMNSMCDSMLKSRTLIVKRFFIFHGLLKSLFEIQHLVWQAESVCEQMCWTALHSGGLQQLLSGQLKTTGIYVKQQQSQNNGFISEILYLHLWGEALQERTENMLADGIQMHLFYFSQILFHTGLISTLSFVFYIKNISSSQFVIESLNLKEFLYACHIVATLVHIIKSGYQIVEGVFL